LVLALLLSHGAASAGRIAAGAYNAYVVDADGTVWAWGANLYGQLCDGTTEHRFIPSRLPGLAGVADVSAGGSHGLARKLDGSLVAWGLNNTDSSGRGAGQLGDGTRINRATPVAVLSAGAHLHVVAGAYHSLAINANGSLTGWGYNQQGQVGDASAQSRETPVAVAGATGVVAVAAGCLHSLALKSDGTALAWGFNSTGQLGDGTSTDRLAPVAVAGLDNIAALGAGCAHSVALKKDGTVWAWGFNLDGQLGSSSAGLVQRSPKQVPGLSGITAIAVGNHHNLALAGDGRVWSWGKNDQGQLGDGGTSGRSAVAVVQGLNAVSELAAGQNFALALASAGEVYAWGQNDFGQLGSGTSQSSAVPVAVKSADGSVFRVGSTPSSGLNAEADRVFAWAERTYPDHFSPSGVATVDTVAGYRLRAYSASGSYLGVNTIGTPHLYYLGPVSNQSVLDLDVLSIWLTLAGP
jgi:alpha-tubulin suppressor-like RCC1 family protein